MSEYRVTFDDEEARAFFAHIDRSLADFEPLWEDAKNLVLRPSIRQNFDEEGRPNSWPELSKNYAKRKLREVGFLDLLVYSGTLRDSLIAESGNQYTVDETAERSMVFGTTRPWAWTHQEGAGAMPEREFLLFQPQDIDAIAAMAGDFILGEGRYAVR